MSPDDNLVLANMTPEERVAAYDKYYGGVSGTPGVNMSAPPPPDPSMSYYNSPAPAIPVPMNATIGPTRADAPPPPPPPVDPDEQAWLKAGARAPGSPGYGGAASPGSAPATYARAYTGDKAAPVGTKEAYEQELLYAAPDVAAKRSGYTPPAAAAAPSDSGAKGGGVIQEKPVTIPGTPPPRGGGGGGGGFREDPSLRKQFYATFAGEQDAVNALRDAEMAKHDALAAGMAVIGADRVEQSVIAEKRAAYERDLMSRYQDETQRQMDEVRSQTVDPNRLYKDGGAKAMAIIGGILGGLYQGINKLQSNPYIDQMNRMIDQDIAIQERQLERNSKAVGARHGILADMRTTFHDEDLAKSQAKALYYEGLKQQLAAEAAKYDSPAIAARAMKANQEISRQVGALKLDEQAKKVMAQAAAAAFARAEAQREDERNRKWYEAETHRITAVKSGKGDTLNERFVPVGHDEHNNPIGYLARGRESAEKAVEHVKAIDETLALIDRAEEIRNKAGWTGRAVNRGGPLLGAVPVYKPEWMSQMAVIEGSISNKVRVGAQMGAFDAGTKESLLPMTGNLTTIGEDADVRLQEMRALLNKQKQIHQGLMAGQRTVKLVGEEIVPMGGGANAPLNDRGTSGIQREK